MDSSSIIIIIIAVTLALIGIFAGRKKFVNKPLEIFEHGKTILARVTDIEERKERSMLPPNPPALDLMQQVVNIRYYIRAEWTDPRTKQTYNFVSNPLLDVPEHIEVGKPVKVKIDPNDPYDYMIDIAP